MTELPDNETRIGVDEWVAQAADRFEQRKGLLGVWDRAATSVPPSSRFVPLLAAAAVFGVATSDQYYLRVGFNTLVYVLLALGLNVVVGWAGLLDLGFVAFFGFGAYSYALLSSAQFGVHLPTPVTMLLVALGAAALGLLLGLPSRRLLGDYLAIVTLFFGQIFYVLVNNANRITLPWQRHASDITGGPNGIANLDNMDFFGLRVSSVRGYYYVALAMVAGVAGCLWLVSRSRTGRAWHAVRDDQLAAQSLGIPINSLKILAFVFGAVVAGLAGTVFAALQSGVFPNNFYLDLLITLYAMVILGGVGSLAGVVVGAVTINVGLEVLRTPSNSRLLFYCVLAAALLRWLRPWRWLAAVVAGTVAFGFVVHAVVVASWPSGTDPDPTGGQSRALAGWIVELTNPEKVGNAAYAALVLAVLGTTLLTPTLRRICLIPLIYLAAFVWENRLALEPSVTRLVLLGALLVGLMNVRPEGMLGKARVDVP